MDEEGNGKWNWPKGDSALGGRGLNVRRNHGTLSESAGCCGYIFVELSGGGRNEMDGGERSVMIASVNDNKGISGDIG
jgi:hypothetical protein